MQRGRAWSYIGHCFLTSFTSRACLPQLRPLPLLPPIPICLGAKMSTCQPSLKTFLARARNALTADSVKSSLPFTFVVGNESADLDSLCSTVVLAFLRSNIAPYRLHIPLSNLPRPDLGLRLELGPILAKAGLDTSHLITLTDLPEQLDPDNTEWLLVDHNCLTGPLKRYKDRIVGCIDHHVDEGFLPPHISPRVIETCGSCMSLIVDTYKDEWRALVSGPQSPEAGRSIAPEYTHLAQIAMGPILIDTVNFCDEAKVRPKDLSAAALLREELMDDSEFDPTAYYAAITAAREDLTRLSLRDILRKDYKEWEDGGIKLGISCVVQNFDFLLSKAAGTADTAAASTARQNLLDHVYSWGCEEQKLDVVSVMTTSGPGGDFQRHLLVWALTERGETAVRRFRDDFSGRLKLETWRGGLLDLHEVRYSWRQHDLSSSRKQVAPLMREAMRQAGANL